MRILESGLCCINSVLNASPQLNGHSIFNAMLKCWLLHSPDDLKQV